MILLQYNIIDYRPTPPTNPSTYSRPPLSASKRSVLYRAASIEQNDRFDNKPDRSIRSSSLQRPSSYLPAFDHIQFFYLHFSLGIRVRLFFLYLIRLFCVYVCVIFISLLILVNFIISEMYIDILQIVFGFFLYRVFFPLSSYKQFVH